MGIGKSELAADLDALSERLPVLGRAVAQFGYPEPRLRPCGYEALLRTIVGQQVSFKAAASIWAKLESAVGEIGNPHALLGRSFDELRAAGLSRQKQSYARSLAEHVASGALDLHRLPADDEEAIALLTAVKGIGRWSAEIYLLFAEGRRDVWPAGDLAVQIAYGRLLGMEGRPSERQLREVALPWSPYRGAAAIFGWHIYLKGDLVY